MGKKIPSSIIIERLLFQQGRDLLISPTPLIPLPSDWFQSKPVRSMLVRGKMVEGGGGLPPPPSKEPPSPSSLISTRMCLGAGRGQGEGKILLIIIKNLGVINQWLFYSLF